MLNKLLIYIEFIKYWSKSQIEFTLLLGHERNSQLFYAVTFPAYFQ